MPFFRAPISKWLTALSKRRVQLGFESFARAHARQNYTRLTLRTLRKASLAKDCKADQAEGIPPVRSILPSTFRSKGYGAQVGGGLRRSITAIGQRDALTENATSAAVLRGQFRDPPVFQFFRERLV